MSKNQREKVINRIKSLGGNASKKDSTSRLVLKLSKLTRNRFAQTTTERNQRKRIRKARG